MNKVYSVVAAAVCSLAIASPALATFDPAFSRSYDRQLIEAGARKAAPATTGSVIATHDGSRVGGVERAVESMDSHRDN